MYVNSCPSWEVVGNCWEEQSHSHAPTVLPFRTVGFSSWRCLPVAIFGAKTAVLCLMVKNRDRLCPNVFVQRKRHRSVIKDLLFPKSALRHSVPTTVLWIIPQTQRGFPNAGPWKVPRGRFSLPSVAPPAELHRGAVAVPSYAHVYLSLSTGTGSTSCLWWWNFLFSSSRGGSGVLVSFTRWFNFGDGSRRAPPQVLCQGFAWSWLASGHPWGHPSLADQS